MRAKSPKSLQANGETEDRLTLAEGIAIIAVLSLLGGLCFGVVAV